MNIKTTEVFTKTVKAYYDGKRRILHEGGTSSSKTWSILQFLILLASGSKEPLLISIVSESLPHLKRGCIRDFFNIMGEVPDGNERFNKTESIYTLGKCRIEFFGADEQDKVRGPRRDILYINECNNVPWDTARHLDVRTSKLTIVDWNPVAEFWAHEQWKDKPESEYIHSTYLDAKNVLPDSTVRDIESYKDSDPNWWRVYGLGLVGKIEHLIWPNFEIVDELPPRVNWINWAYGLDFGFKVPTAMIKVINSDGKRYADEVIFQEKLTNSDIIERMTHMERADIYADSAEPDRIEEICRAGYSCYPANKKVNMGLDVVKRQPLYITKRSVGLLKEIRNYSYKKDKDGNITDEPIKIRDHGCDALRYAALGLTERFGYATVAPGGSKVTSWSWE